MYGVVLRRATELSMYGQSSMGADEQGQRQDMDGVEFKFCQAGYKRCMEYI